MAVNLSNGTGRRKTAVARVFLREGNGTITVNDRELETYFPNSDQVQILKQPLDVTDLLNKYDIKINVSGGGINGQAGACRLGLARALSEHMPSVRDVLRANGFLSRDPRMVERKKYGQRGARRKFQFSKR